MIMSSRECLSVSLWCQKVHTYSWQAWQFIVHHSGNMKLKQLHIFSYDVSSRTTLLVSFKLVVDFDDVGQFVGQVIL